MAHKPGHRRDDVAIDVTRPANFTGGLEFTALTYTVTAKKKGDNGKWATQEVELLRRVTGYAPKGFVTAVMGPSGAGKSTLLDALAGRIAAGSLAGRVSLDGAPMSPALVKRASAYVMQDDRLFPMLTVHETLMFAADFRLGGIGVAEKKRRVERLIEQLGLSSARNTYIGDEGTRGVSGGERRRVTIGVDIIHGPPLLFLDEPTSGLDSTSAHSVVDKLHLIARSGSTVILTIHQPSSRILSLLDHLVILARGHLVFQGAPSNVISHLRRIGRKVPAGESAVERLIDVVQEYDQCPEVGVRALAEFARTGVKPPKVGDGDFSMVSTGTVAAEEDFDRSLRSPYNNNNASRSWSAAGRGGVVQKMFTPSRAARGDRSKAQNSLSGASPYAYSSEILPSTPTPHDSDYTVTEHDYMTPGASVERRNYGPKFANGLVTETWVLMRRNFKNIRRTPELFLSRLVVLAVMGTMMATMFLHPPPTLQGVTNRLSFFIFTVCIVFFSSNDAVPAFIQERSVFVRETSFNAYRASSYTVAGLITYLPFLALQAIVYALIVWFALELRGPFLYFFAVLYASLLSTNSFVVFVSSVVPNYILGYAAVIAFTALFFLFCGFFLAAGDIPAYWRWMNYVSTMTYPYRALLINEYKTDGVFGQNPETGTGITGEMILQSLGVDGGSSEKWINLAALLGWAVFYRVLFYLVLRFASKNQRT